MKVLISESLSHNANSIIPSEKANCVELIGNFFGQDYGETEFAKRCNAARFIFDDVSTYSTNRKRYVDDDYVIISAIKKMNLLNELGMPLAPNELVNKIYLDLQGLTTIKNIREFIEKITPTKTNLSDGILLSPDPFISSLQVGSLSAINREVLLLTLATSGIEIVLPSVFIKEKDEIDRFKEKFEEERLDYLLYLQNSLDEMIPILTESKCNYGEVYEFAKNKFELDLKLKAERINLSVKKEGKRAIKYMYEDFVGKIPSIGSAAISLNFHELGKQVFEVIFSGIKAKKDTRKLLDEYKEISYIYRISQV